MAFIAIEIEVPGMSEIQLNQYLTADSKSHEGVQQLSNLLAGISGGAIDASVAVVVSDVTNSLTASSAGNEASHNLK